MDSIQSPLISQIINNTLAQEPQSTGCSPAVLLAEALIHSEAAGARSPVENAFSKFFRVMRNTFVTDEKTRLYYDLKAGLTEIAKGLKSGEIIFSVQDAKRERALRAVYDGNGKKVFAKAAGDLHEAIAQLGLEESKVKKLQALVKSIKSSLEQTTTFREEFTENKEAAEIISQSLEELKSPTANLSDIETTLKSVQPTIDSQSALGEKLKNAQDALKIKKLIESIKPTFQNATSIQQLFDFAAVAIKSSGLDPELKTLFVKDLEHELKRSIGKMLHDFKNQSLDLIATMSEDRETFFSQSSELKNMFKNIALTHDIPDELASSKKFYHETAKSTQKVQGAYLRTYKKQLKFEAAHFSAYIQKEQSLERLAVCRQHMNTLYAIVELCEQATNNETSPEVAELVDALHEQLDILELKLTKKLNEHLAQQQKAYQEQLMQLEASTQKSKTQTMIGNKERQVVHIAPEPSQKAAVTALGVALSALKWVPVIGQPVAELGEALHDRQTTLLEAGISSSLACALLTGYVVHSGVNPLQPGGFIFSALKVAPLLTPNIVAYITRQCPPGSVLPRPLALALGMATAGATAYVLYRGPLNIASDLFWYGVQTIPGAATAVGGAAFNISKKATIYAASSTYSAVTSKLSDLGNALLKSMF